MRCFLLVLIYFVAQLLPVSAQNPFVKNYNVNSGLFSNETYSVFQDSKGFIWISSNVGAIRFDGNNFKLFNKNNGLDDDVVIRIKEDSKGRVWFINYNGSLNFLLNGNIHNQFNTPFLKELKAGLHYVTFVEEDDGDLLFYNYRYLFKRLNKKNNSVSHLDPKDFSDDYCALVAVNIINDSILLWAQEALCFFDTINNKIQLIKKIPKTTRCITQGSETMFLTKDGHFYEYLKTKQVVHDSIPVKSDHVIWVIKDHLKKIWISTFNQGVFVIEDNKISDHYNIPGAQSIMFDDHYNAWIASMHNGVYEIICKDKNVTHYPITLFNGTPMTAVLCDLEGGIWASNYQTLYHINKSLIKKSHSIPIFINIKELQLFNKRDIVCTNGFNKIIHLKNVYHINQNEVCIDSIIGYSVIQKIIFALPGVDSILYANMNSYSIANINSLKLMSSNLINSRIHSVFYRIDSGIVVNSEKCYELIPHKNLLVEDSSYPANKAITKHIIFNDSLEVFKVDNSNILVKYKEILKPLLYETNFPGNFPIIDITCSKKFVYLATSRKVFKIHDIESAFNNKILDIQPIRLLFNQINDIQFSDNILYVFSKDGVTLLKESAFSEDQVAPVAFVDKIIISDTTNIPVSDKIITISSKDKIQINYGCILHSGHMAEYAYRIKGLSDSWTVSSEPSKTYDFLPPGEFVFELKARGRGLDFGKIVSLNINVEPTFFQRGIVLLFSVITFLALAFFVLYIIQKRGIKELEKQKKIILLEQKALQSMMNPHFIFNSLGSIQSFLLQNDGKQASLYLSRFSRLIRQNLNSLQSEFINLEDEIDRLKNYIDLEKLRLNNSFVFYIDTGNIKEDIVIPAMVIQPFVENAIWHGLSPLQYTGILKIEFNTIDDVLLQIVISDNGIGIEKSKQRGLKAKHVSIGMDLTEKRLEILSLTYKRDFKYFADKLLPQHENPGTKITITVPYQLED